MAKRVGRTMYWHRLAIPDDVRPTVGRVIQLAGAVPPWNVFKLDRTHQKASLLFYPRFMDDAFPALAMSVTCSLATGRVQVRRFKEANQPILHRKELLLPLGHPAIPAAEALTAACEAAGLFDDTNRIGWRNGWEAALKEAGVAVTGSTLVDATP